MRGDGEARVKAKVLAMSSDGEQRQGRNDDGDGRWQGRAMTRTSDGVTESCNQRKEKSYTEREVGRGCLTSTQMR